MHFDTREDYIRWATVHLLTCMDIRVDHAAVDSAHALAIKVADLFFKRGAEQQAAPRGQDPYSDPPAVRAPPGVRTVGPQVPGQKTTLPEENAGG